LASSIAKKFDVIDCHFGHVILILLLHYLVKCRSRSLDVDNNEFILGSACIGSEMIDRLVTNMSNTYYCSKSHTCYITSSVLQHLFIMFSPPARMHVVDVETTRQQHIQ